MSGPGAEKTFVADVRRRWSREEKLALVAETKTAPVSRVAREHGVASGLLFRWRKALGDQVGLKEASFVPLMLPAPEKPSAAAASSPADSGIEIVLRSGCRVRVGRDVDKSALKRVIEVLETE